MDRGLLRALAAGPDVGGRLDVVGGLVRAGVAVERRRGVLLQLHRGGLRVLGGADAGLDVGHLAVEPAAQRLAGGLLVGGGAGVEDGAGERRRVCGLPDARCRVPRSDK